MDSMRTFETGLSISEPSIHVNEKFTLKIYAFKNKYLLKVSCQRHKVLLDFIPIEAGSQQEKALLKSSYQRIRYALE